MQMLHQLSMPPPTLDCWGNLIAAEVFVAAAVAAAAAPLHQEPWALCTAAGRDR